MYLVLFPKVTLWSKDGQLFFCFFVFFVNETTHLFVEGAGAVKNFLILFKKPLALKTA